MVEVFSPNCKKSLNFLVLTVKGDIVSNVIFVSVLM